jgi:hypothetical protein
MDRFVCEMIYQGIPRYAINLVENSIEWKVKFKNFDESRILHMIEFYPIFYRTVIKPLNQTTERELDELTRQFNSSNLNTAMEL